MADDELSITVLNEAGSISSVSSLTDPNFVPATTAANMFIGRGLIPDADLLAAVPEPSSLLMVLLVLPGLWLVRLRHRK